MLQDKTKPQTPRFLLAHPCFELCQNSSIHNHSFLQSHPLWPQKTKGQNPVLQLCAFNNINNLWMKTFAWVWSLGVYVVSTSSSRDQNFVCGWKPVSWSSPWVAAEFYGKKCSWMKTRDPSLSLTLMLKIQLWIKPWAWRLAKLFKNNIYIYKQKHLLAYVFRPKNEILCLTFFGFWPKPSVGQNQTLQP